MSKKRLLSYISNEDLYKCVKAVVDPIQEAVKEKEKTLYKNVIDPFSAVFDSIINEMPLTQWIAAEKSRQIQKTLQNKIGIFHQSLIGKIEGWEDLGTGEVVDLRNKDRKIIAEIKNKFNTTKGNHKIAIYDDLENRLKGYDRNWTAYYVEIIRKSKTSYCRPFTPSDNKTHQKREENSQIKVIDGESFYSLATGSKTALVDLYKVLPSVIREIVGCTIEIEKDKVYQELFKKAYNIEL